MNQKTFEAWNTRADECRQLFRIAAHHATPGCPVNPGLPTGCFPFRFKGGFINRLRHAVQRHVHQRGNAARGRSLRCGLEAFPLRASGLVDVHMRIHQARQKHKVTKIAQVASEHGLIPINHARYAPVLHQQRRRPQALGRQYLGRAKCLSHTFFTFAGWGVAGQVHSAIRP